jgi:hypothetical protein
MQVVGQDSNTKDEQHAQRALTASYWAGMQWDKAVTLRMNSKHKELQHQVTGKERKQDEETLIMLFHTH